MVIDVTFLTMTNSHISSTFQRKCKGQSDNKVALYSNDATRLDSEPLQMLFDTEQFQLHVAS